MKAIILALIFFTIVTSIFLAVGVPDFQDLGHVSSGSSLNTNLNPSSLESKLSRALENVKAMQKTINNSSAMNLTANNSSSINSSVLSSADINLTDGSQTNGVSAAGAAVSMSNGGSGASSISGNSSASPQEVGSNSKASFNGYWGMEAKQGGIGKSDINSRTFLSGGFEVDKTVQFQDRGF